MNDNDKDKAKNEKQDKAKETPAAPENAQGLEQAAPATPTPEQQIADLKAQYQQMREIAARAQADGINYRNWAEREMKRLKAYGSERAITALLPVLDNLDLALQNAEADPAKIRDGVKIVRGQFADALKGLGVKEIDPVGKTFSPMEHDALGMTPVADKTQDGLIQTVVRKGYQLSEKVIRPAMVMVGRYTPPAPAAPEAPAKPEAQEPKKD